MRTAAALAGMLFLILDSKTALQGAQQGLELCIRTVIPSLFPFFILSILLTNGLTGRKISWLKPVCRMFHIPEGSESLLLIGFLGGYPVGAQAVSQAWRAGQLDKENARRMLGFCSNAGPAFLFGILGGMFSSPLIPWVLWLIHILSALFVALILPASSSCATKIRHAENISVSTALERSIGIMARVCGWIILFRVIIAILDRWILWMVPDTFENVLIGLLELTNGCCLLSSVESEGLRFILASCFLAFGGLCVSMQTVSVTGTLGTGMYFPGKILQLVISLLLSSGFQMLCFPAAQRITVRPMMVGSILPMGMILIFFLKKSKNKGSIPVLSGV